jgi:hypothetical protein
MDYPVLSAVLKTAGIAGNDRSKRRAESTKNIQVPGSLDAAGPSRYIHAFVTGPFEATP